MTHAGNPLFTANVLACVAGVLLCAPAFSLDLDRSVGQFYNTFWSEKDGAPSQINALAQTTDGYLWIGSQQGLFRFDGVKFEEYNPQPGVELPSHSIYSLMATPDGGLWIAFEPHGIAFLKDGSLTVFARPEENPDSPVHCFARDLEGRIWAGTENGLVLRQGTRWIPIGHDWNLTPEMIRYLLVDREGTLWVATVKIVAYLRRGSKKFELGGPVGTGITSLAEGKDGRVWFADDGSFEAGPVPTGGHKSNADGPAVVENGLREVLFDRDGALWITRMESGIVRIRYPEKLGNRKYGPRDPELESFGVNHGFSGGYATKLLEDREGNIWVGCSNGLIRFRHNQVVPVSLPQGYEKLTMLAGEDGKLSIGTINDKPLLQIRGEGFSAEKVPGEISSVLQHKKGDTWWGSRTGIWRQRDASFEYFPLPSDVAPDFMYDIMPSTKDGGLFVKVGDVAFIHFNQGVWNLNDWPKDVPSAGPFRFGPSASYHDPSGRVWLGYTAGQVCVIDGGQVTCYSQKDGLDVGRIKAIRGRGQHIWVGGELGLLFFSEHRFRRVMVAGGKQFGAVSGIIETADGGLWLNEMTGIVRIPPEEIRQFIVDPNHPVTYRRFDFLDGLPGAPQMSFTNSTAVEASDGRLWFATGNGLARIDPAHLAKNVVPPPVVILSIGNQKGRLAISNAVKFGAGTHTVEIDYTALSLSIPERVEFRYMLEGVDAEWQNVGTRRQADYSNLGPGPYRFRVIASNNDGVWNETGASFDFAIAPAYYQTNSFRVTCLAALLAALWGLYRYRLHQIAREFNMRMEERVGERSRVARDLHDTLLQGFQGLMLRLQAVYELLPQGEAKAELEQTLDRADQVVTESRKAVHDLRLSTVVSNDLERAVRALGDELSSENSATFGLVVEGQTQELHPIVRDEFYRIAREALRNAFSHSRAQHIEVEITYAERLLRLRIRDDGKGIAPAILEEGRDGHYGLPGMRERAAEIGAKLDIWSGIGAGTEIDLSVPGSIAYRKPLDRSRWRLSRAKAE
jgi:signal transduction histidine kinase/ligand-binding sensor domain-containing protein